MIRQMREQYQGRDAKMLPPMMFAGIIMEGGIVGYDSNTLTGGSGVRLFGIGASTQYQSDTVTVTLRTVSVSTGEILTTVTVTKTVLSYMDKITLLRFVGDGTTLGTNANALEGEIGGSINESINKAIDVAVQAAVIQTINEGARKGHWSFKEERNELVQSQTPAQRAPEVAPAPLQPIDTEGTRESKAVEPKTDNKEAITPEVKVEPKAELKPEVKTGLTVTAVQTGLKPPVDLFGPRYLKEDSYIYKEANEKSQRTWLFKKGTELYIITPGPEGWHQVRDAMKRSGFVKQDVLSDKP
jgi:hypothetical protein